MRSFELNARSLCEICYVPDHVRCWTRNAYESVGGHDLGLLAGDDHDLVWRTYLNGVERAHMGSCDYMYRSEESSSVWRHKTQIDAQRGANCERYLRELIDEWLRRTGLDSLAQPAADLTCFSAVDHANLPAEDGTVGCVSVARVLQEIGVFDVVAFMNAVYRVLVPGVWFCAMVANSKGLSSVNDGGALSWSEGAFDFFCQADLADQLDGSKSRFRRLGLQNAWRLRTTLRASRLTCAH